jgi:hypothetical protein ELI_2635
MDRQKAKKLIIGIVLLVLGVAWLGDAVNFWDFDLFFPGWWAALLMLCFFVSIVSDGPNVGNVFFMLIFGAIVLKKNNIIPDFVNIWLVAFALAVIIFGGKIIVDAFRGGKKPEHPQSGGDAGFGGAQSTGDHVSYTFTGETLRFAGQTVQHCSYSVSFGSLTLDFSGAVFAEDAYLSVSANFGEVKILLPAGIKADPQNSAAFASIKNQSQGNALVKCRLDCAFGCISVTNG